MPGGNGNGNGKCLETAAAHSRRISSQSNKSSPKEELDLKNISILCSPPFLTFKLPLNFNHKPSQHLIQNLNPVLWMLSMLSPLLLMLKRRRRLAWQSPSHHRYHHHH